MRKIEQPEPEPKHYVLRVGDTVETPSGQLIKVVSSSVEQIEFKLREGFKAKLPNGQTITATEKGYEVTQ
jgi:preprotein translocase subunit YajC